MLDTKCRINLIGLEKDEIKGAIEGAAMILGLDVSLLKNFQYNAKTFLQRRKIGGQETLVYVALLPSHQHGVSLFPMTAGLSVLMGMVMQTPTNGSTSSEGFHFYRQSFDKVGMALTAFEGCVQLLMKEVGQSTLPSEVQLSKDTYDPFIEVHKAVAKVSDLTEEALDTVRVARSEALNFASNETVSEIVDIFDGLGDVLVRAHTRAKRNLKEIALRMKAM